MPSGRGTRFIMGRQLTKGEVPKPGAKCEVKLGFHFTLPQIQAGALSKYKCEVQYGRDFTLFKYERGAPANISVKCRALYIPLDPISDLRSRCKYRASHFTLPAFVAKCEVAGLHFTLPLHTSPDTRRPPFADITVKSNMAPLHTSVRPRRGRKCEVAGPSSLHTSHFQGVSSYGPASAL
jgi:hypothetical protein